MKPDDDRKWCITEQCWLGIACLLFWAVVIMIIFFGCAMGAQVKLTWNPNPEPDIAGYVIHYGTGSLAEQVPAGNVTTHTLTGLEAGTEYQFALRAINTSGISSDLSATITHTTSAADPLDRENWTLMVSSEEPGQPKASAIDGNPATYWRSRHSPTPAIPPHTLLIDLGSEASIGGFRYLPRQTESTSGDLSQYEWATSTNGTDWQTIRSGTREPGKAEFAVIHPAVSCRFVRLTWLDTPAASCAEIHLLPGVIDPPPQPMARLTLQSSPDLQTWADLHTMEIIATATQFFRIKIETP